MRVLVGLLMGLISGFLFYMMAAMIFTRPDQPPSAVFVAITFFGGWAVSSWLLIREARSTSTVFRRGFLLGAAEWLCMALAVIVFSGKAVGSAVSQSGGSDAATAGATLGGGLVATLGAGFSVFMAVVCFLGFGVAYFIGREMHDKTTLPTRKCPECAEMIQAEAKKCRFCGAVFATAPD